MTGWDERRERPDARISKRDGTACTGTGLSTASQAKASFFAKILGGSKAVSKLNVCRTLSICERTSPQNIDDRRCRRRGATVPQYSSQLPTLTKQDHDPVVHTWKTQNKTGSGDLQVFLQAELP